MVEIPAFVPERARAVWRRIREYYDPANDPDGDRRFDLCGEVGAVIYLGEEPLLEEIDKVGMIMQEMRCTFARRFLEAGPLTERQDDLETIERAVAVMTITFHGQLLRTAGVLPKDRQLDPGNEREVVRRAERLWHDQVVIPQLERLAQRREQDLEWYRALMNDEAPAIDRATRVPQLYMHIIWRSGVYGSAREVREIMRRAVRMHEAYKPKCIKEGDELLGPGRFAGPARLALMFEAQQGFDRFLRVGQHGQIVIAPMQAKEGFDDLNGRTWEEKAEHSTIREADLTADEDGGRFQIPAPAERTGEAKLALSEAREILAGSELASLLDGVLQAFDQAAETDPALAAELAGELTKIVLLVRSIEEPALRAGVFSAWVRGSKYRGRISREEIAEAFGVSMATVRRWEEEGQQRLAMLAPPD